MNAEKLRAAAQALRREVEITTATLQEKGSNRFAKAFILAFALVLGAYMLVYRPPQQKGARLAKQIEAAKARAEFGGQYKALSDQLAEIYKKLPADTDREQWLSNSVRDSLSVGGLVTEDFKPVRETENSGLIFQMSLVSVNVRFSEFFDWLLRIENARPMMHLQSLELVKKPESLGMNIATAEVGTVIPKQRYR